MPYDDLRKGRFSEAGRAYFITTVLADRSKPWFADLQIARLVVAEMRHAQESEFVETYAWVVMPDHVHWLFQLGHTAQLEQVLKSFKARSARSINSCLQRQGQVWQKAYYDHALREEEDLRGIARYIVANPLRAGIVEKIGDYPHWDAAWL